MQPQTQGQTSTASNLDPQAVNLAKAIRQTESGGNFQAKGKSGEYGAYQFTEPTWNSQSKKYGLNVPLAQATPEQQNEVAYKQIKEWKDKGHNVGEIASMWNAGEGNSQAYLKGNSGTNKYGVKYDTGAYAKSVATAYQTLKNGGQAQIDPNNPSSTANSQSQEGGAWFKSSPDDSPVTAGLKALGNTPQSAGNFIKGLISGPLNIPKQIGEIGSQFSELSKESGGAGKAIINTLKEAPMAAVKTLVPEGVRQAATGDIAGATKSFTEDPFGQAAPVVLAAEGGAKLADNIASKSAMADYVKNIGENYKEPIPKPTTKYSDAFGKSVEMVASPVTKTAGLIGKALPSIGGIGTSLVSHLTGLDPQTVGQIISNPSEFSKIKQEAMSRQSLASDFSNAIDNFIETKKDTGTEYGAIRTMDKPVQVPPNFIQDTLGEFKLGLKKGKVVADTTSLTRNPADIKAVQNFVDNWGKKTSLTPEEYLNMRKDIEGIAKHGKDIGTNIDAQKVGKRLYDQANEKIGKQIPGLRELDAKMSPQIEQFKQIKKDFLNPDGTFKDGAISKISNAAGRGKENLLARMEELSPGITQRIKILKAVEDIQHASGLKVGNYTQAGLKTAGLIGSGLPGFLIAQILTSPEMAVPILRKAGYIGAKASSVIEALKFIVGDVPNKAVKAGAFNQDALKSRSTGLLPQSRMLQNTPQ